MGGATTSGPYAHLPPGLRGRPHLCPQELEDVGSPSGPAAERLAEVPAVQDEFPAPAPDLAAFVERYWVVDRDYAQPYRQKIVPYPDVHLTVRPGGDPEVHGVASRHVARVLGAPVASLTDRAVRAADVPGLPPGRPEEPVDAASVERWLAALPDADPDGTRAGEIVARVAAYRGITRVDQLAARCGTSVRGLQRLFAEHVGVGPT